jgi:hypothetical protein
MRVNQDVPSLNTFAELNPEISTIGITFDDSQIAKDFATRHDFDLPLFANAEIFIKAVGIKRFPTMALIGPDGRIVGISTSSEIAGSGKQFSLESLSRWLRKISNSSASNSR